MKSYTLDWNCIIALERAEPQGKCVAQLVDLHRTRCADVAVTTVSASENLAGSRVFPASGKAFNERLSKLGLDDLSLERGPGVIGLTYIGMSKIVQNDFEAEIDQLWGVIAPNVPRKPPDDISQGQLWSRKYSKWRNAWCDVHTLWAHIDSGRGVFVTTNTNDFQRHFGRLHLLGLNAVKSPCEAVE